jgi:hypothetical protein
VTEPVDTQVALVRLWAQTTADLIDVAQAFWNGLINLNPAESDTKSAACEGSTVVPPQATATTLGHSQFIDAHGNTLPNPSVQLEPDRVEAGTTTRVSVYVAPDGVHAGRYTAVLLDAATGNPVSSRFSVYMAG